MARILFCSFFTDAYTEDAQALARTLNDFNLEFEISFYRGGGGWIGNCGYKPLFILSALERHRKNYDAIVWLDADARVRKYPRLFFEYCGHFDYAAHWNMKRGRELLSGTLYFATTDPSIELVMRWADQQGNNRSGWDQRNLQTVIKDSRSGMPKKYPLCGTDLPPEYCAIFDAEMCKPQDVVIEHLQASRRLKSIEDAVLK